MEMDILSPNDSAIIWKDIREGYLSSSLEEENMKRCRLILGVVLCLAFILALPTEGLAQQPPAKVRASLKAGVMQTLGTDAVITIEYGRPGVKGRKIWGELVPYGLAPGTKYSENKPYPWRAGANETTTIELNKDVLIEGKPLPAGKYGIHMIPGEKDGSSSSTRTAPLGEATPISRRKTPFASRSLRSKLPSRSGWNSGSMTWREHRQRLTFIG